MKTAKILVVDDERAIRRVLQETLQYEGYEVDTAEDGQQGFDKIKAGGIDLVLCDIKMPKMDGMDMLREAHALDEALPIIMISGHGNTDVAHEATKHGAYDFFEKPPDLNKLLISVRNALERRLLVTEAQQLKEQAGKTQQIVGESGAIQKIKQTIDLVAPTDARVLVTGENGSGKELVARWLHEKSNRAKGPLVEVNCAAIPSELIESEMFGHEKGAFTSAIKQRMGKFEEANGGTLFLDEIGDMNLAAQAKVLRALQEHKITRVGGTKEISVDVRVVSATNKDLVKEIDRGNFRLDLYHRLNVIHIHVPSLNERRDDIPLLANHFLQIVCKEYGMPAKSFNEGAMNSLKAYNWTGNIRELRNVVERLVILGGQNISAEDVMAYTRPLQFENHLSALIDQFSDLQEFADRMEKNFLERKLELNQWNVAKTAEEIGIQRSNLTAKMEKLKLRKEEV